MTHIGHVFSSKKYALIIVFNFPDLNIPETGQQRQSSLTGDEDCCYTHCGSPGRGKRDGQQPADAPDTNPGAKHLGICEHCPGRPNSQEDSESVSSRAARTNKVSLFWTSALFMLCVQQTLDFFRASLLLRCLLYSARTVHRKFFNFRTNS